MILLKSLSASNKIIVDSLVICWTVCFQDSVGELDDMNSSKCDRGHLKNDIHTFLLCS